MSNLGFVPAWQFDKDANTNPALNPFVKFPEGMYQTTTQPVGPYFQSNMSGHNVNLSGTGSLGLEPIDNVNAIFDSFWWRHRKALVVGGAVAVGLGVIGGLAAILR